MSGSINRCAYRTRSLELVTLAEPAGKEVIDNRPLADEGWSAFACKVLPRKKFSNGFIDRLWMRNWSHMPKTLEFPHLNAWQCVRQKSRDRQGRWRGFLAHHVEYWYVQSPEHVKRSRLGEQCVNPAANIHNRGNDRRSA
jgi:hypothetical protein